MKSLKTNGFGDRKRLLWLWLLTALSAALLLAVPGGVLRAYAEDEIVVRKDRYNNYYDGEGYKLVELGTTRELGPAGMVYDRLAKVSWRIFPADPYTEGMAGFTFASSNEKVAVVDEEGNVEGIGYGTAKITMRSSKGIQASCTVTVERPKASGVRLNKASDTLNIGETLQLTGTVTPAGSGEVITWSSSNPGIASVSASGLVTAKTSGTATITARAVIVQSDPEASNEICMAGGTTVLANVQLNRKNIYTVNEDECQDVILELMKGTRNSIINGQIWIQGRLYSHTFTIQGSGSLSIDAGSNAAIWGHNIIIKEGTLTLRVYGSLYSVIGNQTNSNVTILPGAKVTAYNGYSAVGGGKYGNKEPINISIAEGSLTYFPNG